MMGDDRHSEKIQDENDDDDDVLCVLVCMRMKWKKI